MQYTMLATSSQAVRAACGNGCPRNAHGRRRPTTGRRAAFLPVWLALACCAAAAGVDPGALPVNTWTPFTPVFAEPSGRHVAVGWNKMVYDETGKRAILMDRWQDSLRGQTIYANAVIAVYPAEGKAAVLKLNNYKRQDKEAGGYSTVPLDDLLVKDPTPVDRHPYGDMAWCGHNNSLYLGPGANRTWKQHPRDFWRFDLTAKTWHALDPAGSPGEGKLNMLESVMCYDSAARVLVFFNARDNTTWLHNIADGKWRKSSAKTQPKAGMGAAMAYDAKRQRVYLFGGPGSAGKEWNTPGPELWAFSAQKEEWTRLADSPVPARAPGLAYDSRHDILLASIVVPDKPNANLIYDPATDRWSALQASGPKGSWMCLCYDSARDLFIQMAGGYADVRWWVLRYAPGGRE